MWRWKMCIGGCVVEVWSYVVFFFFFQAEDGIRDIGVTGVQTCALPIWVLVRDSFSQFTSLYKNVTNDLPLLGVAQWIEHPPGVRKVVGLNPVMGFEFLIGIIGLKKKRLMLEKKYIIIVTSLVTKCRTLTLNLWNNHTKDKLYMAVTIIILEVNCMGQNVLIQY